MHRHAHFLNVPAAQIIRPFERETERLIEEVEDVGSEWYEWSCIYYSTVYYKNCIFVYNVNNAYDCVFIDICIHS